MRLFGDAELLVHVVRDALEIAESGRQTGEGGSGRHGQVGGQVEGGGHRRDDVEPGLIPEVHALGARVADFRGVIIAEARWTPKVQVRP